MSKSWWVSDRREYAGTWNERLQDVLNPNGWSYGGTRIEILKAIKRNGEIIFEARWANSPDRFRFDVDPHERLIAEIYYANTRKLKQEGVENK